MVQKGKFSAGIDNLVRTLNSVLLPTLGRPTIPICAAAVNPVQSKCSLGLSGNSGATNAAGPPGHRSVPEDTRKKLLVPKILHSSSIVLVSTTASISCKQSRQTFRCDLKRPRIGLSFGSSFFFGGILCSQPVSCLSAAPLLGRNSFREGFAAGLLKRRAAAGAARSGALCKWRMQRKRVLDQQIDNADDQCGKETKAAAESARAFLLRATCCTGRVSSSLSLSVRHRQHRTSQWHAQSVPLSLPHSIKLFNTTRQRLDLHLLPCRPLRLCTELSDCLPVRSDTDRLP